MKIKFNDLGRCLVCCKNPCQCKKKKLICDYCGQQVEKLVDTPYMADVGNMMCKKCWQLLDQNTVRIGKNQIIWGGNYFINYLYPTMGWIVWDKGQKDFSLADGELAWTSFQKALRIFTVARSTALLDGKQHPTQKSLEVIRRCIKYADRALGKENITILDPFLGSGTTAVACQELHRNFIGIEISEKYCKIAEDRLKQKPLF